jgi:hypothetical protein
MGGNMKAAFLVLATALLLFAACGGGGGSHPTAGEWAGHWLGEYVAPVAPEGPEEGELFATISDGWIWIGLQPDGANFHWQISDLQIAERSDERLVLRTGEVEVVFGVALTPPRRLEMVSLHLVSPQHSGRRDFSLPLADPVTPRSPVPSLPGSP